MRLRRTIAISLLVLTTLSALSCGSTAIVVRQIGIRILRGVAGSQADRDTLCKYYTEHREEVEAVREFANASWDRIPEKYKPALLAINEQLNACEPEPGEARSPKTTARALLDALRRIVALHRELTAAGVL